MLTEDRTFSQLFSAMVMNRAGWSALVKSATLHMELRKADMTPEEIASATHRLVQAVRELVEKQLAGQSISLSHLAEGQQTVVAALLNFSSLLVDKRSSVREKLHTEVSRQLEDIDMRWLNHRIYSKERTAKLLLSTSAVARKCAIVHLMVTYADYMKANGGRYGLLFLSTTQQHSVCFDISGVPISVVPRSYWCDKKPKNGKDFKELVIRAVRLNGGVGNPGLVVVEDMDAISERSLLYMSEAINNVGRAASSMLKCPTVGFGWCQMRQSADFIIGDSSDATGAAPIFATHGEGKAKTIKLFEGIDGGYIQEIFEKEQLKEVGGDLDLRSSIQESNKQFTQ